MKATKLFILLSALGLILFNLAPGCFTRNDPPRVEVINPGYGIHAVDIKYMLYDDGRGGLCRVKGYYSIDGVDFSSQATIHPLSPDCATGLDPNNDSNNGLYTFLWDAYRDLGPGLFETVYFKLVPYDEDEGKGGCTDSFIVNNNENTKPTTQIIMSVQNEVDPDNWFNSWIFDQYLDFRNDTDNGTLYYTYSIGPAVKAGFMQLFKDSSRDNASLVAQGGFYGIYDPVYFEGGTTVNGSVTLSENAFILLWSVTETGNTNVFSNWYFDKRLDLQYDTRSNQVNYAYDVEVNAANQSVITIQFYYYDPSIGGNVILAAGSALLSLGHVEFFGSSSLKGTVEFDNTAAGSGGGYIVFDIAQSTRQGSFTITSNIPEPVSVNGFLRNYPTLRGNIVIGYFVADSNQDTVDVSVMFSINGGDYIRTTEAVGTGSGGTGYLLAERGGTKYFYVWESVRNLGYNRWENVKIKVFPTDNSNDGTAAFSQTFKIDNRLGYDQFLDCSSSLLESNPANCRDGALGRFFDNDVDIFCAAEGDDFIYRKSGLLGYSVYQFAGFPDIDTRAAASGDFNADGYPDIFVGTDGFAFAYMNLGNGSFTNVLLPGRPNVQGAAVGRFDESKPTAVQVFSANFGANYIYARGVTSWTYYNVSGTDRKLARRSYGVAVGDLDNNGFDDAFVCNDGPNNIFLNPLPLTSGDAWDNTDELINPEENPNSLTYDAVIGDFDCDFIPDIVAVGKELLYYHGLGLSTGHFGNTSMSLPTFELKKYWIPQISETARTVAVMDFDNDTDLDLIIGTYGRVHFLRNVQGRFFDCSVHILPTSEFRTNRVLIDDVNLDGRPDIILLNRGTNKILKQGILP
jgi:hypothetical protein